MIVYMFYCFIKIILNLNKKLYKYYLRKNIIYWVFTGL